VKSANRDILIGTSLVWTIAN